MSIIMDLPEYESSLADAPPRPVQSRPEAAKPRVASPGAERVPLYSEGRLAAFMRRTRLAEMPCPPVSESPREESADLRLERSIAARWQAEAGTSPARIGISATNGVVRLSGTVETVHDRMALCRIAAAMDETQAIIDELWVACE